MKVKVKVARNRLKSLGGGGGLHYLDLSAKKGWDVSRASLDVCEKSRPLLGFNPQTVQPVASHYTD
jgi:hypothetical protein